MIWEETSHLQRIISQMTEEQPLLISIITPFTSEEPGTFDAIREATMKGLKLQEIIQEHVKTKILVCSKSNGDGIVEGLQWLKDNADYRKLGEWGNNCLIS